MQYRLISNRFVFSGKTHVTIYAYRQRYWVVKFLTLEATSATFMDLLYISCNAYRMTTGLRHGSIITIALHVYTQLDKKSVHEPLSTFSSSQSRFGWAIHSSLRSPRSNLKSGYGWPQEFLQHTKHYHKINIQNPERSSGLQTGYHTSYLRIHQRFTQATVYNNRKV